MHRLGQGEGADCRQLSHCRKPALFLLLGAEQRDRFHRQSRLDAEERSEAAVAAVQFHVHQSAGERGHPRAAVALDVLPEEAELGQAAHQRPRQLGRLPVLVDLRQHFVVDEAAGGEEVLPLLVGELVADVEVVGRECITEVGVREGSAWTWRAPLSTVVDVGAGRLAERRVIRAAEALRGGLELTRPVGQPLVVVRPPASIPCGRQLGPCLSALRIRRQRRDSSSGSRRRAG